ncbi:MAG: ABC transporter permease [Micavibrio aeruginosavorus]|uniref:ABC transporter permease n=1 Tax=Micavibrio aeruginosavorus TaxID=349221 RepID=A0A2W5A0I5_9BACT|nr:MAG: ABC transporter permease [Micavibrio aeruginosavorus]
MNILILSCASIKARPLQSFLCVLATAVAIALLCFAMLVSGAISDTLSRNTGGVDVVVGAKGSAMQLVLSTVYHVDVPTGNISGKEYERIAKNPQVKKAVPLALGDNYRGYRIVGTNEGFVDLYKMQIEEGRLFNKVFEVTAGAKTGLKIGDRFAGSHGLAAHEGHVHEEHLYEVVGILKERGVIADRLILTSVKSVQDLHNHHDHDEDSHEEIHGHGHEHEHDVTAILIQTKSKLGMMNLPRQLNSEESVMAAAPSYEMAKLARNIGIGKNVVNFAAGMLVFFSALIILACLVSGLSARRYDLAVMRVHGARPWHLAGVMVAESLLLAVAGTLLGIMLGHLLSYLAFSMAGQWSGLVSVHAAGPNMLDIYLLATGMLAGLFAAIIPAWLAARTDIATLLAKGRG